jgi:hypothetical protein
MTPQEIADNYSLEEIEMAIQIIEKVERKIKK